MADLISPHTARNDSQARIAAALNGQAVIAGGLHIGLKGLAERIGAFASAPQDNPLSPTLRTLYLAAEFTGYWGVAGMLNALHRLAYGIEVTPVLSIKREEYLDRVRTLAAGLNVLGTHLGDVAEGQVSSYTPLQEHYVKVQRKIKPRLLELPPGHLEMVSFMPVAPSIEVDVLWRPHPQAGHGALVTALGSLATEISRVRLDEVAAANPYPSLSGFFEAAAVEIVVGGERPLAASMGREFERLHQVLKSGPPLVPPAPDLMAFSSLMFVVAHAQLEHGGAQALCRRYKLRRNAGQRAVSMSDVARKFADAMVKAGEAYSQCASTRTPAPVETIAEQLLRESGVLGSSAVSALASALRRHATGWKANPELDFDTWAFGAALVLLLQEATAEWGQEQTQDDLAAVADVMAATGEIVRCETFTRKTRATAIRSACGELLAEARQLNIDIEASVRSAGEDTLSHGQVDALQRGAGARLAALLAVVAGLCDCLSLPWGAALSRELSRRAQISESWVAAGARADLFDGFMRVVAFVERLRPNSLIDIQDEELGEFAAVLNVPLPDQQPYLNPPEDAPSLDADPTALAIEGAAAEQWAAAVPDDVLLGEVEDAAIPQYEAGGEVPADIVAEHALDASQDLPLPEARPIEDLGAGAGAATLGRNFDAVAQGNDMEADCASGPGLAGVGLSGASDEAAAVSASSPAMSDAMPALADDGCGFGVDFAEPHNAGGAMLSSPAVANTLAGLGAGSEGSGEGAATALDGDVAWVVEPNVDAVAPTPAVKGNEPGAVSAEPLGADVTAAGRSFQMDVKLVLGASFETVGQDSTAAPNDDVAWAGGPIEPVAHQLPSTEAPGAVFMAPPSAEAAPEAAHDLVSDGAVLQAEGGAWVCDSGTERAAAAFGAVVLLPGDVDGVGLGGLGDIEAMMGELLSGQRPATAQHRSKGKPSMDPERLYEALLAPAHGLPNVLDISDAELMSIMFEEASGFLDSIDATLALWRIGGVAANQLCGTVGEIRRLVHSLKGVIRTCGLAGAGAVLHAMEDRLEVTADDGSDLDSDVPVYLEAMAAVRATIELGRDQFERGAVGPLPATGPGHDGGVRDTDPALQVPEDVQPLIAQLGDLPVPDDVVLAVVDNGEPEGQFAEPEALSFEPVDVAADLHFGAESGAISLEPALPDLAEPQPPLEMANPRAGNDLGRLAFEQHSAGVVPAANSAEFGFAMEMEPAAAQVGESLGAVADSGLPSAAPEGALSALEAAVAAAASVLAPWPVAEPVHQMVEVAEAPAAALDLQPGEAQVMTNAPAMAEPVAVSPAPAPAPARGEGSVRIPLRLANRVGDASGQLQAAGHRAQEDLLLTGRHLQDLQENLVRMGGVIREIDILAAASVPTSSSSPAVRGFDPLELDRYGALQEQVRRLAEAFDDVQASARGLTDDVRRTQNTEQARAQVSDELQRDASELTLVDVGTQRVRLERTVAKACADARRSARLVIEAGCRVPGAALDKLMPVFEHLLRNAVAHGIEPADAREAAAKPAVGTISVGAPHACANADGSVLRIAVRDDGRGIDHDRVLAIAVSRGLALQGVRYSRDQIRNFLFMPGFSTASAVSELAGRGVGLDVVHAALTTLGGMVAIDSADGQGTEFVLTLPTDSASMAVIPVSALGYRCLLPLSLVRRVVSLSSGEDVAIDEAGARARVAGQEYPLITLASRVPVNEGAAVRQGRGHLVLLSESQTVTAVLVDTVGQQSRVVVRQLGPIVRDVPGMVAGTALADGQVGLVVNPLRLQEVAPQLHPTADATAAAPPLVLVVDDSATVRLVTSRFLKRLGYQAVAARDGVEALQMIDDGLAPDGILLDLEMPGIDGFELLAQLRAQPCFATVPMVVISSRVGAKYAERARELGATAYLAKPYEDATLQGLLSKMLVSRAKARLFEPMPLRSALYPAGS